MALVSVSAMLGKVGDAMTRPASTLPSTRKPWSHTDDAMLTEMYERGIDVPTICKRLKRTYSSVRMRLRKIGVNRAYTLHQRSRRGALTNQDEMRRWTDDEVALLHKMHARSTPLAQMAKRLNRSIRGVHNKARRLGLRHSVYHISMTASELATLLGIDPLGFTYRCRDAASPIPHRQHGRMKDFDYADVYEWLEAGNILGFNRTKLDPTLHRMYDDWRRRALSSKELRTACNSIYEWLGRYSSAEQRIAYGPTHEVFYHKDAVYELAYQRGHTIPPDARGDFVAVRTAWLTEWVHRKDIDVAYGQTMVRYHIKKYIGELPGYAVRRADLCEVLRKRGMESEVKRWQSVPIPWQELVADYERTVR